MQALILAGGLGTRLRPLTIHTPKPVVPIANRPFLLYQIDLIKRLNLRHVILCLSYQPKKIEQMLADGRGHDVHIEYLVEATPLGTAGAFKNAESMIAGPTLVFNGDVLTDLDLEQAIGFHRRKGAVATIVLATVDNPSAYGLVETYSDGRVKGFLEKPKLDQISCNTINAGTYILEPSMLKHIPANRPVSFEYDFFPALLRDNQPLYAFAPNCYWIDIGTPARYLQANLDVIGGQLTSYKPTSDSAEEAFRESGKIDSVSLLDSGVRVEFGATITNSIIGRNCLVGEGAVVENSVIWAGSSMGPGAKVSNAILGNNCRVGRSASIAGGVVLADNSLVTDFAEVYPEPGRSPESSC